MQKSRLFTILSAATVLSGGPALADAPGRFEGAVKLAEPAAAPSQTRIVGVTWRCAADGCVGEADRYTTLDSVQRECGQVAAVLGSVTAYASRGVRLSRSELAACNRAAVSKTSLD